jgi:hypothetical protein
MYASFGCVDLIMSRGYILRTVMLQMVYRMQEAPLVYDLVVVIR